jgi:hypothetical protein
MGQETSAALIVDSAAASNDVSVVRGIRRLLVTAVLGSLICSWLIVASKGGCYESGGCIDLRLSVSPLLFIGFAVIVFLALGRIINRNLDPFAATRVLDRAGLVVKIVAIVAIVVAQVWFALVPMEDFATRGGSIISPFPFGIIEVTTSTDAG